jgi:hypothetical protein
MSARRPRGKGGGSGKTGHHSGRCNGQQTDKKRALLGKKPKNSKVKRNRYKNLLRRHTSTSYMLAA